MNLLRTMFLCLALLGVSNMASAQGVANLIADRVSVQNNGVLIAEGNVEVFFDGTKLTAQRLVYDQSTDRLTIEGPIFIIGADGTILTADQADLDPQLQNGLLRGARLVLDQQLQLGANQINRVDGRYSQLFQVVATSCRVCGDEAPLWEIRARRVIHDEQEQQLYFDGAQLRVGNVPILYLPRLRLPDPTLERATGFLTPRFRSTDQLGTGIKTPYFIRLGDHRDLTFTPYLSRETRTLDLRYRQAFHNGRLELNAGISQDTIVPDDTRGYAQLQGQFDLTRDFELSFDLITVSDDGYLLDYGHSSNDLLDSQIAITRTTQDQYIEASLNHYQSLRDIDDNATLTSWVGAFDYQQRLHPNRLGGVLTLSGGGDTLFRTSQADMIGRDVSWLGVDAQWQRNWIGPAGLVLDFETGFQVDLYDVAQDSNYEDTLMRTAPRAGITLRWPLAKTNSNGVAHLIEPMAQIAWSDAHGDTPPNEDSILNEFDESNLLSLTRFAGQDRVETGLRSAFGARWTRQSPQGWRSTLTFGRVFRSQNQDDLSLSSGFSGTASDWLVAGQLDFANGLSVDLRTLLNENDVTSKSQIQVNWLRDNLNMTAGYLYLPIDTGESRDAAISEWTFDADYQINDVWSVNGEASYDIIADSAAKTGFGIGWRNECVEVDLSVSRRFTSSTNVDPTTDIGLSVGIAGFSAGRSGAFAAQSCDE